MTHLLRGGFLLLVCLPLVALAQESRESAATKQAHPPHPEDAGLRIEITAVLDDMIASDGRDWYWSRAALLVDVAVRNVSTAPITVPTTSFDGRIIFHEWPGWGQEFERIILMISPPVFQGQPTVFSESRFHPVTLAPGECALIVSRIYSIVDRKHADAVKQVSVHFGVTEKFAGLVPWWRGHLEGYQTIRREKDPEQEIARLKSALPPKSPATPEKPASR